jgi:outer membrane protein insertion porin family
MIHAQETTIYDDISPAVYADASPAAEVVDTVPDIQDTLYQVEHDTPSDICIDEQAVKNEETMDMHEDIHDEETSTNGIEDAAEESVPGLPIEERTIRDIIVQGAHHIPVEAILDRIPYRIGEQFNPDKSRILLRTLYYELQRFQRIDLEVETIGDNELDIYIIVEEKKPLLGVTFTGLHKVTTKEINEKINFAEIPALDEQEVDKYARMINKIYTEKGYLHTEIKPEVTETDGKLTVVFHITEHPKSTIKRIEFEGNEYVSGKTLRSIMFTREDWIMSFMDKSGTYNPEWLERDKHMIEQYYQNNGFMNAKIYDTQIIAEDDSNYITILLQVDEGHKYQFGTVTVDGANLLSEEFLLEHMPVQPGTDYSREAIVDSLKFLEFMFGDLGYLYTHIEPSIQPNDETRTVDVHFSVDPGKRVYLNKLTIRGNKKTRDKIIRRNIHLQEGGIITNNLMEVSKTKVESLGYFDTRDGVNWKTTRISEEEADLDLVVKEVKTGNANFKIGFGGPEIIGENTFRDYVNQLMTGVSVEGNIADTNVAGTGIRFNVTGKLSTKEQDVLVNLTQPWLFDKPIYGSIDGFHRRAAYDQLRFAFAMNEQRSSGSFTLGVVTGWRTVPFFNDTYIRANFGFDRLVYDRNPQAIRPAIPEPRATEARDEYQVVLNKLFYPGACAVHFPWLNIQIGQDKKNHPMHPSRGYTWMMRGMFAFPSFDSNIGYAKWDLDVNWFTPLINEHDLVLRLHGYAGIAKPFNNRFIPYRELFHIGGPASIRGYLFGQIGPQFTVFEDGFNLGDSIGAENTVFFNAELIFPILPDMTLKALAFYDGGAGWQNPYACDISPQFLRNNNFDYRHAVGFGLRLLNPMPMKIDWGFKLDPRRGEPGYEVHFAMGYDW